MKLAQKPELKEAPPKRFTYTLFTLWTTNQQRSTHTLLVFFVMRSLQKREADFSGGMIVHSQHVNVSRNFTHRALLKFQVVYTCWLASLSQIRQMCMISLILFAVLILFILFCKVTTKLVYLSVTGIHLNYTHCAFFILCFVYINMQT